MDTGKRALEETLAANQSSYPLNVFYDNFEHFEALGVFGMDGGVDTYLIDGSKYAYQAETMKKQEALFRAGQVSKHALQIGCYLGHSVLLLLLSNEKLKVTVIDVDDTYAGPVVEYLNKHFGDRVHFIHASPLGAIKVLEGHVYDLIHFENPDEAKLFYASRRLSKNGTFYIFNHYERIKEYVDELITKNILKIITQPECLFANVVTYLVE